MRLSFARLLSMLTLVGLIGACGADNPPAPPPLATPSINTTAPVFSIAELEQMVAPIALFPDPLLAQVLMASTYPGEVAEAATWSQQHPEVSGDTAVVHVSVKPWDPNVKALAAFPQVLAMLSQDPAWVQRLGDAYLANPRAVLEAVQRLRQRAVEAGNLASNDYVDVEPVPGPTEEEDYYAIEPTDEDFVYVPEYDSGEVYGDWYYDDYPPVYYPGSPIWYPGTGLGTIVRWGVGIAIADALWSRFTWGGDNPGIDIDIDRYNGLNADRRDARDQRWQHDSRHRNGVPYRDAGSRERYGNRLADAPQRDAYRGDDMARAQMRAQERATMGDRGISSATDRAGTLAQARVANDARGGGPAADDYAQRLARGEIAIRPSAQEQVAQDRRLEEAATRERANAEWDRQRAEVNAREQATARAEAQARQPAYNNAFDGSRRPADSRVERDRGERSRNNAGRDRSASPPARPVSRPARGGGARGGGRGR